jgi:hypothetical protein
VGKRSLYSFALRRISDFRDMYLSRYASGRLIRQAYYGHGWDTIELYMEQKWWLGATCVVVLAIAGLWQRQKSNRLRSGSTTAAGSK